LIEPIGRHSLPLLFSERFQPVSLMSLINEENQKIPSLRRYNLCDSGGFIAYMNGANAVVVVVVEIDDDTASAAYDDDDDYMIISEEAGGNKVTG
jgi:hypothetical protein